MSRALQLYTAGSGGAPGGAAGGDLSGTYPDPQIASGVIVNADINASAAIAKSKLASLAIVNADVDAAAAIAKSKLASLAIVNADVDAAAAIAYSKLNLAGSILLADLVQATKERALAFGKAGSISATETDAADFLVAIPFNATLLRMKVTCKTAPSGAMVVQLRSSTNSGSSFSDVSGFVVTFSASAKIAVVDPANVDVAEGDILNFSASTGSGANLLTELVLMPR